VRQTAGTARRQRVLHCETKPFAQATKTITRAVVDEEAVGLGAAVRLDLEVPRLSSRAHREHVVGGRLRRLSNQEQPYTERRHNAEKQRCTNHQHRARFQATPKSIQLTPSRHTPKKDWYRINCEGTDTTMLAVPWRWHQQNKCRNPESRKRREKREECCTYQCRYRLARARVQPLFEAICLERVLPIQPHYNS
jgi:hypothetical protein